MSGEGYFSEEEQPQGSPPLPANIWDAYLRHFQTRGGLDHRILTVEMNPNLIPLS